MEIIVAKSMFPITSEFCLGDFMENSKMYRNKKKTGMNWSAEVKVKNSPVKQGKDDKTGKYFQEKRPDFSQQ